MPVFLVELSINQINPTSEITQADISKQKNIWDGPKLSIEEGIERTDKIKGMRGDSNDGEVDSTEKE